MAANGNRGPRWGIRSTADRDLGRRVVGNVRYDFRRNVMLAVLRNYNIRLDEGTGPFKSVSPDDRCLLNGLTVQTAGPQDPC